MKNKKVIIVGGGLGGLAAAARLSRLSFEVSIFDNNPRVGGKLNYFEEAGFKFDTGPHLITMPEVFQELFQDLGYDWKTLIEPIVLPSLGKAYFPDGATFDFSLDSAKLKTEFDKFGEDSWQSWLNFQKLGKKIYNLSHKTFLSSPPSGWFKQPPDENMLLPLSVLRNYHHLISKYFHHPQLIQLMDRYATYVGASPFSAPGMLAVIPYIEYHFKPHYLKGGLYTLAVALEKILKSQGASIYTSSRITRIHTKDGRVRGVLDEKENFHEADLVIYNGDSSLMPELLTGAKPEIKFTKRSMSGFVLLLGLSQKIDLTHHHNIFFSSDYKQEFEEIFQDGFAQDPTVYLSCPSLSDSSLVPNASHSSLFIMINATKGKNASWTSDKTEQALEVIFKKLKKSGFDISRASIVTQKIFSPKTIEETYLAPFGSIYGSSSDSLLGSFLRPGLKPSSPKGLYCVGGSYHPGGGTPMVLLSAKMTVNLIKQNELN